MATKKTITKKKVAVKKTASEKIDPKFIEALRDVEAMGKDLINASNDPFKLGCNIASELRNAANRVENEAMAEGISLTEASYSSEIIVGVGVGVI
jgi:hypothetical protein